MPEQEKHWTLLGTSIGPVADGPEIAVGESVEVVPVSSLEELREGIRAEIAWWKERFPGALIVSRLEQLLPEER
jgi:hypothetical protein